MEQNTNNDLPLHKRDDPKPKNGISDDLAGRIKGLELSKTYEGMSPADIAALDRMIAKLKEKLARPSQSQAQNETEKTVI
jgi:hypothetical protein